MCCVQIGVKEAAEKLLRIYGDAAEEECDARVFYYERQGDKAVADGWRRTREMILQMRTQKKGGS